MILIVGTLLFFGMFIRLLGFAPVVFIGTFVTALASKRNNVVSALAIALGVTVLCVAVFIFGLGVPLALVGPWLGGV